MTTKKPAAAKKADSGVPQLRLVSLSKGETSVLQKALTGEQPVKSNAVEEEDGFRQYYIGGANDRGVLVPPFNLYRLSQLCQQNNALGPCVEAMVTNVDGTGYDFEADQEEKEDTEDDSNIEHLHDFFNEPWPGVPFLDLRRDVRRDVEQIGNGYLEVIRNVEKQIMLMRRVDGKMMRMIKLDAPIQISKTLRRNGADIDVQMMVRQRRYVQNLNGIGLVYFKEFGAQGDLNKTSGEWGTKDAPVPAELLATEILHFIAIPDAKSPYGVPRWIAQTPSVVGSRQAEEFNLSFFDEGGIPPVLILLQGGALSQETRKAIEGKMVFGKASDKNRVQVLEVEPTIGGINDTAKPTVTVERFGGDRTTDAMFADYDAACEEKVRRAFRLPPIFIGAAEDYTFASAYASYTVAEAQVFKPERDRFDEMISMKLIPELGFQGYRMISNPLTIEDATIKLQGIELGQAVGGVAPEDMLKEINEATGTNLKVSDNPLDHISPTQLTVDANGNIIPITQLAPVPAAPGARVPPVPPAAAPKPAGSSPGTTAPKKPASPAASKTSPGKQPGAANSNGTPVKTPAKKMVEELTVTQMAMDALVALRKRNMPELSRAMGLYQMLDEHGQEEFRKAAATLQFVNPGYDADGLGELAGCTLAVMHANLS